MSALVVPATIVAIALLTARGLAWLLLGAWSWLLRRSDQCLSRWSPLLTALPPLVGLALAAAVLVPANPVARLLGASYDASVTGELLHLDLGHPPGPWPLLPFSLLVALVLAAGPAWRWLRVVRGCWQARTLLASAQDAGKGPLLADLDTPNAVSAGLLRPRIVADRRWWSALSEPERAVVLAHEGAHVCRRDPLTLASLLILGAFAPRRVMERMLHAWEDHAELLADSHAAAVLGDPLTVAEALLRHHKRSSLIPGFTTAWTGGRLERRVEALLADPPTPPSLRPDIDVVVLLCFGTLTLAVLAAAPRLHSLAELILNQLL